MSIRSAEGAGPSGEEAGRDGERRAATAPRVQFEALVAVGEDAGNGFEAESVDVSPDGMRLRTAYLPAEGDRLCCRFDGMGNEIVAEGEVLWRKEEQKGGEFGLRFVGLDDATSAQLRAMCMTLGDPGEEAPAEAEPAVARGSRVRLHIEGLGSPMKARVRETGAREIAVGSNLEFLKVGRALEVEDVDAGAKREATIDDVKVDVDPGTHVPQLVVKLRFERASAAEKDGARASVAPATRRAAPPPPAERPAEARRSAKTERMAAAKDADGEDVAPAVTAQSFAARAALAGRAVAGKVAPALAGFGARAKNAAQGMAAFYEKRRMESADARKAPAQRRTTAPPPGGALTSDGRRLVRDEALPEDEIALPMRSNRRAAATGGALGLAVVLGIFGIVRLAGHGHADGASATAAADAHSATAVAALPPAPEPAAAPGTPTANVPLFGATPLSTTEPAPGAAPSAMASAAPSAAPSAQPSDPADDEPTPGDGRIQKEWGQGAVSHPVVLKLKMDGAIETINGASGAMGFTISVPGRRSISSATDLTRKDKRLASVNVVNTSHGAEITVQFKDGVPPYLAKVKGDRLEIALGKEGHSKIAKKKKHKKKSHDDDE